MTSSCLQTYAVGHDFIEMLACEFEAKTRSPDATAHKRLQKYSCVKNSAPILSRAKQTLRAVISSEITSLSSSTPISHIILSWLGTLLCRSSSALPGGVLLKNAGSLGFQNHSLQNSTLTPCKVTESTGQHEYSDENTGVEF